MKIQPMYSSSCRVCFYPFVYMSSLIFTHQKTHLFEEPAFMNSEVALGLSGICINYVINNNKKKNWLQ